MEAPPPTTELTVLELNGALSGKEEVALDETPAAEDADDVVVQVVELEAPAAVEAPVAPVCPATPEMMEPVAEYGNGTDELTPAADDAPVPIGVLGVRTPVGDATPD